MFTFSVKEQFKGLSAGTFVSAGNSLNVVSSEVLLLEHHAELGPSSQRVA